MAPETRELNEDRQGDQGLPDPQPLVPLEVLERQLTSHAAHQAAAEAQWLGWLGQYCVREGWHEWGCSGPVQWLSWRCGMLPSTGRDKVRVALALRELPVIAARFGEGRLSYSKVRALTRVATPKSDADLAELALAATGSQLDVIMRSYKNALDADKGALSAWRQRSWRSRADGEETTVFTLRVPNDQADLVQAAVTAEVNKMIDDELGIHPERGRSDVTDGRGGWSAMSADAAISLMNGTARSDAVLPASVEIVVSDEAHAHHSGTSCSDGADDGLLFTQQGRWLPRSVGERLCCDPRIAVLIEGAKGAILAVGTKTRVVSRKLRRALDRRDGAQCQFPGCASQRRLHAHHIIHWSNGGPTELDNLILLCSFHHHVVHEGGWNIDPRDRAFMKPDGSVVEPVPTKRFRGSADVIARIGSFAGPAPLAEAENRRFDLGLVLEGLAFDHAESFRLCEVARSASRSHIEHGPPVPTQLRRQRLVEAHWERTRSLSTPV